MTTAVSQHQAHVDRILAQVETELTAKYLAGQREHGGRLWLKAGMLGHLKAELLDHIVYCYTLEEQIPMLARTLALEVEGDASCATERLARRFEVTLRRFLLDTGGE